MAIAGDTVEAGPSDDDGASNSGSAYVFLDTLAPTPQPTHLPTQRTSSWPQLAKMVAGDAAAGDYFGRSVAASGDLVAVGADGDDSNTGSVYILRLDSSAAGYTQLKNGGDPQR